MTNTNTKIQYLSNMCKILIYYYTIKLTQRTNINFVPISLYLIYL